MKNFIQRELMKEFDMIRNRSTRAVCGTFEREIIVNNSQVAKMKETIKKMGNVIIGTGKAGFNSTKIWFNPQGVNL